LLKKGRRPIVRGAAGAENKKGSVTKLVLGSEEDGRADKMAFTVFMSLGSHKLKDKLDEGKARKRGPCLMLLKK
jgi:hypothetical protein